MIDTDALLRVPATAAGRRLLATWLAGRTHPPSVQRLRDFTDLVLAIEDEAPAWPSPDDEAAVERLADARIAVSGEINPTPTDRRWWIEDSRAILTALAEAAS